MLKKKIKETENLSEIKRIKKAAEAELLKRSGITGVDIGYKYVGGKKTDEIAIRVLVEEKKDVPKNEKIPDKIDNVKTDVIQRKFVLHPLRVPVTELTPQADTGNYSPLKGGISIGPCRAIDGYVYTGTLGVVVKDNATGKPMLLSNFHVMCVDDGWSTGDTMAQPSRVDTGNCPANVVGTLSRASLGGQVDCAIASSTARSQVCEIVDIGPVNGTANATLGMNVRKRGRTTGLTYGTVDGIDGTVTIDYGDGLGIVTLTNQITVQADTARNAKFSDHGDSGAAVVNDEGAVVGLNFAGDDNDPTYAAANPIQAVLNALNVSICAPAIVPICRPISRDIACIRIRDMPCIRVRETACIRIRDMPCIRVRENPCIRRPEFCLRRDIPVGCRIRDVICRVEGCRIEGPPVGPDIPDIINPGIIREMYAEIIDASLEAVRSLSDAGYSDEELANFLEQAAAEEEAHLEEIKEMINELRGEGSQHFKRMTR